MLEKIKQIRRIISIHRCCNKSSKFECEAVQKLESKMGKKAVQKCANRVNHEEYCKMNVWLQKIGCDKAEHRPRQGCCPMRAREP